MKKLLLIIPLLIWVACEDKSEDESKEPFSLVDEWVRCPRIGLVSNYEDGTTKTLDYQWDGLSMDTYIDGSLYSLSLYNNYGSELYRERVDIGTKYYSEYDDGWKLTRYFSIEDNGDTATNRTYTWEGLTRTRYDGENIYTQTHNSYGNILLFTHPQGNVRQEYTYKEDGRRILDYKSYSFNELIAQDIYEWDGNTYEINSYTVGGNYKNIGEINEHGYITKYERYSCEDEDNCTLYKTVEFEYDCNYFDPIPN